jgi:hypothetical protein
LGRLQPFSQTLGSAGKACRDKHTRLLQKSVIYGRKMFYDIGPRTANNQRLCSYNALRLLQRTDEQRHNLKA